MMFQDTVTVFNQKDNMWYPTVLEGVEAQEVVAESTNKDGNFSENQCNLHIPEALMETYVKPKQWSGDGYTLRSEDFFVIGNYGEPQVNDDDYTAGFMDYMKNNFDGVYKIVSVSVYKAIKHIEVIGA